MVRQFAVTPEPLYVTPPAHTPAVIIQRLEAELDELWGFVGKKTNRHWIWIAMDAATRQVLASHVGDRSGQSVTARWKKISLVYQGRSYSIRISMQSTPSSFPPSNATLSRRSPARRIMWSALTAPYDNGSLGWCAPCCRSRRSRLIISGR